MTGMQPARALTRRWWVGLVLGPLVFLLPQFLSPLPNVTPLGMWTLGTFLLVVVWWICETLPIPVTALTGMALLVVGGVFPVDKAFGYWANWVNIFLIGAFIIGHAANVHGVNRRFAYYMLSLPFVAGRPWRLVWTFWAATAVLSAISSNVVCTLVFMGVAIGLLDTLKVTRTHPVGGVLMLGVAWAAGIGGIVTPVGTPPNLIAIGLLDRAGYHVNFLHWSAIGLTTALCCMAVLFATMRWIARPDVSVLNVPHEVITAELAGLPPRSRAERLSLLAMGAAMFAWLLPDLAALALGGTHPVAAWLQTRLNWSVSAILIAAALFAVPIDLARGRFLMRWDEAVKGIDWATLSLIAGALALGDAVASPTAGLGRFMSTELAALVAPGTAWYLFVAGSVLAAVLITNFMSNNATVSMVAPIALGIATAPGSAIEPAALGVTIGIASSMAFALPASTPPVAIVYASGRVRIGDMIRYGTVLSVLCGAITGVVTYLVASWIL